MMRSHQALVGLGGAALAALVLLAPVASASSIAAPPFTATPSYATYGALHIASSTVLTAQGRGANRLPLGPAFNVVTGYLRQGQRSQANTWGTYDLTSTAGLRNLTFDCPAGLPGTCSGNQYVVEVNWTIGWSVLLSSTCGGTAVHPTDLASATVTVWAYVVETGTGIIGSTHTTLYDRGIRSPTAVHLSKAAESVDLKFSAPLTDAVGWAYSIETEIIVTTHAQAITASHTTCTSGAVVVIGAGHSARLDSVTVDG